MRIRKSFRLSRFTNTSLSQKWSPGLACSLRCADTARSQRGSGHPLATCGRSVRTAVEAPCPAVNESVLALKGQLDSENIILQLLRAFESGRFSSLAVPRNAAVEVQHDVLLPRELRTTVVVNPQKKPTRP